VPITSQKPGHSSARARTPPDVKWLLNERAAVAGEVENALYRENQLQENLRQAELGVLRAIASVDAIGRLVANKKAALNALDATINLVDSRVEPTAAGLVHAWAGKYGARGAFSAFLVQTLKDAFPAPMTTQLLSNLAVSEFGLGREQTFHLGEFRRSLGRRLRHLRSQNLICVLPSRSVSAVGIWRWNDNPTPTLEQLAAQVQETYRDAERSGDPYAPGPQVAAQ
jgi:hypothetical protein